MFLFDRATKSRLVSADEALPGRDARSFALAGTHTVLGTPIDAPVPTGYEEVVVGMGCFWGAERIFWKLPGVWTTAVGYAGGHTPNPTYEEVCSGRTGHTEVVRVVYNPAKIGFDEVLKAFWEGHDPTQGMRQGNDVGTQYRSAIYWSTDAQRDAAESVEEDVRGVSGRSRLQRRHHRGPAVARTVVRRGLPPAVPGQEPLRLLRPGRHRGVLPGRRRPRRRLTARVGRRRSRRLAKR